MGDFVTVTASDTDQKTTAVDHSVGTVTISGGIDSGSSYPVGASIWIDKKSDAQWSHQLKWDGSEYKGVAATAASASSGDRQLEVTSLDAFAPYTIFQVHDKDGADTGDYSLAAYRVTRVRSADETGGNPVIEFTGVDGGGGLAAAVSSGDAITAWVNIPPSARSARIGQTGVVFSLAGTGGAADDETEPPISEGDMVELSFPGLISKKNQHSKVSSTAPDSIAASRTKKARR